ncbi:MAG: hypothetical protein ACRCVE_05595, partial [Plesiomonas sp.]
ESVVSNVNCLLFVLHPSYPELTSPKLINYFIFIERKRRGICAFFQSTWKSVKRPFLCRHRTRVGPVVPPLQPDTHPSHDADPAVHKNTPDTDSSKPSSDTDLAFAEALSVPVPSFIEPTDGESVL